MARSYFFEQRLRFVFQQPAVDADSGPDIYKGRVTAERPTLPSI